MSTILSESSTFTSTVSVPANGDARNVGSVNAAFQAITNRTKKLRDWLALIDPNDDGAVEALLRPAAGKADAGTASVKLTDGTLNTKAEPGALEFASKKLYFTPDATRLQVSLSDHTHEAIAAIAHQEMVYVNKSVDEHFTTTEYVTSALLAVTLSAAAMPLPSTDYVVEIDANLKSVTFDGGGLFRLAKTALSSTSEIIGSERRVYSSTASNGITVPINTMIQANSDEIPVIISLQGSVGTAGSLDLQAGSTLRVKVTEGTATITGKGAVS